jgi:hypothetical protein
VVAKDDVGGVAYQRAGLVRQLLAERENAVAYGQKDRVEAADKQLAELGYSEPEKEPRQGRESAPAGRSSRPQSTASDDGKSDGGRSGKSTG